MVEHDL